MQASARTEPEWQILSPRLHCYPQFHSRFLPDDRDITIYLPPGYDENPSSAYPALYMHDGQNLFDSGPLPGSFTNRPTWQMAEIADSAIAAGEIEPLLIIGVANTGYRLAEYTPTSDWKLGGGEAEKYGRLLVEDLLPFIATFYRVKPGAANTGLGGSSLGALATLYLGLRFPEIFGRLAVHSPSVWWNHRSILTLLQEMARNHPPRPRIWLDIGESEGEHAIADTDLLERRLRAEGWRGPADIRYQRFPGGSHNEHSWAQRVQPMLRFLFPAPGPHSQF